MRNIAIAVSAITLTYASPGNAQSLDRTQEQQAKELSDDAQQVVGTAGPIDRAAAGISGSAFQFNLSEGEVELGLALNVDLWDSRAEPTKKADVFRITDKDLVIKATAPISKGETFGSLFANDKIVSGTTVTASFSSTSTLVTTGVRNEQETTAIRLACVRKIGFDWGSANKEKQDIAFRYVGQIMNLPAHLNLVDFVGEARQIKLEGAGKELSTLVTSRCLDVGDTYAVLKELDNEERERLTADYERVTYIEEPTFFWGIETSYGQDDYEVLDRPAFEVTSVQRESWEIGGYLGLIGHDLRWSLRAKAAYGRKPELAEEGKECRTVMGAMELECIKGPDGLPKKIDTGLFSVEGRYILGKAGQQQIAFAPLVSYDVEDDDFRFELPIYLAQNDDGKLSGGIKVGYSTKDKDVGIGIFVSTPFSIFF